MVYLRWQKIMKRIFLLIIIVLISSSVAANDSLEILTLEHVIDLFLDKSVELKSVKELYQEKKMDLELYQEYFAKDLDINLESNYNLWEKESNLWSGQQGAEELTKITFTKNLSTDRNLTLSQKLLEKDSDDNLELEGKGGSLTYNHYILRDYDTENDYKQGLMEKELALLEAKEEVRKVKDSLKSEIIDKYYNLIELQKKIEIKEELLKKSQETLKIVKARVKTGHSLEVDKIEAELQVKENKLDLSNLNSKYRLNLRDLSRELEIGLTEKVEFADSERILSFDEFEGWVKRMAYKNNLEVNILRLKIEQEKDLREKLDKDKDFDLRLLGKAVWEKNNDSNDYETDYRVGVRLDYNFNKYEKRKTEQKIKKSEIELNKLSERLKDIRDEVVFEVDDAFLKLEDYESKISLYEKAIVNSEQKLRIADHKYKFGLITISELIDQQIDLAEKRVDYIKNLVNYNRQVYKIEILMGVE
ncbi:hypothetical protein U472_13490 [Orenia metallireducens]|uniref:Outer membrane protein TolC n=2 Tax=Orenia metallireducens TaxID=1413210 RepID=A0A1C0A5G8_9FIRM|nr:hypothetical protein U472_13490 [Orenia metallireducens]